jgi:hypothetical protein
VLELRVTKHVISLVGFAYTGDISDILLGHLNILVFRKSHLAVLHD